MITNLISKTLIAIAIILSIAAFMIGMKYLPDNLFNSPLSEAALFFISITFAVLYFHYTRIVIQWLTGLFSLNQQVSDLQARVKTLKKLINTI